MPKKGKKSKKEKAPAAPSLPPPPAGQDRCTGCGLTWDLDQCDKAENWVTVHVKLPMWSYHDFSFQTRTNTTLYRIKHMILEKHGKAVTSVRLFSGKIGQAFLIRDEYQSLSDVGVIGGAKTDTAEHTIYYDFEPPAAPDNPLLMVDAKTYTPLRKPEAPSRPATAHTTHTAHTGALGAAAGFVSASASPAISPLRMPFAHSAAAATAKVAERPRYLLSSVRS